MKANLIYKISTVAFIAVITLLGLGGRGLCSDVSLWYWTANTAGWYDFTTKSAVTATLSKSCKPDGGWVDLSGNGNIHCGGSNQILHFALNNGQLTSTATATPHGKFMGYSWLSDTTYLNTSSTAITAVDSTDGSIGGTLKLSKGQSFFPTHTNVYELTGNSLTPLDSRDLTPRKHGVVNLPGSGNVGLLETYPQWDLSGAFRGTNFLLFDKQTGAQISSSPFSFPLAASSASILVGANTGTGEILTIPGLQSSGTIASSLPMKWIVIDGNNDIFAGSFSGLQYFNSVGTLQGQVTIPGILGCAVNPYTPYQGTYGGLVYDQTIQSFSSDHTAATFSTNPATVNFSLMQLNWGLAPVQVSILDSDTGASLAKFKRLKYLFDGPNILSDGTGCDSTGGISKIRLLQTFGSSPTSGSTLTTSVPFWDSTSSVQVDNNYTSQGLIMFDINITF
jgi:hypothetical protein